MLFAYKEIQPSYLHPFEASQEGYTALSSGKVALLGYDHSPSRPDLISRSIAEVLLQTQSSAIMHFEPPVPSGNPLTEPSSKGLMLAANYHNGHSEGKYKIVLQDPSNPEVGQWLLWAPPDSDNKTFYKRASFYGSGNGYGFENSPTNPEKIHNYFMHSGTTDEAIQSFRELGFTFVDRILGADYDDPEYERLRALTAKSDPY